MHRFRDSFDRMDTTDHRFGGTTQSGESCPIAQGLCENLQTWCVEGRKSPIPYELNRNHMDPEHSDRPFALRIHNHWGWAVAGVYPSIGWAFLRIKELHVTQRVSLI